MFTVDKIRRPDPSRLYKCLMACNRATQKMPLWLVFVSIACCLMPLADGVGYSYTRFVGPVRGPEQQVYVTDANGGEQHLDYIAKPEYEFAYGVEDADARILHNRNEIRDGDAVKGVYSLVDPDGTLRVVKYTADNVNGFKAEVITNGLSTLHGQPANGIDGDYNNYNDYHYNLPTLPPSAAPSPAAASSSTPNGYRPTYDQYGNQPYQPPTYQPLLQLPGITSTKNPTAAGTQTDKANPQYKVHESQEDDDDYNDTEDDDEGDEKEEKYADSEEEELEDYDEGADQNEADANASGEEY